MFKTQNFCHIASNNRNTVKVGVFVYRTTDNLATVSASGYFNDRIIDINLHDLIIHEQIDNADATKVKHNLLCVTERTLENIGTTVIKTDWEEEIDEIIGDGGFVRTDGTSVMTGPLLMRATDDFKCAVAPYWDGVGFFKLNNNNSVTLMASLEYEDSFTPATDNKYDLGASTKRWKDARIARVITAVVNNGYDIAVPVTASADTLALKSQVDLAANSGAQLYTTGVWYAKMYAATVVPTGAEYDGRNYADFSQVDNDNNPIIVIYEGQSGVWAELTRITPPAEYNGYITVTSKIWDIAEQAGQQGGKVLWSHTSKTFTPYPQIISFENINVTGDSTVAMPVMPSGTQIVNKQYVDDAIAAIPSSETLDTLDIDIVGDPVITNNILTTHSAGDYVTLPGVFDFNYSGSFEIKYVFSIPSPQSTASIPLILGYQPGRTSVSIIGATGGNGAITWGISAFHRLTGTTILQNNIKYYVRVIYDSTTDVISLYLSTDDINYNLEASAAATGVTGCKLSSIEVGNTNQNFVFYLDETKIKYKDQTIYSGLTAPGLHQRAPRGHEVIKFQAPDSTNNYTWYRKYADGWIEQGGKTTNSTIGLPIQMLDSDYFVQVTGAAGSNDNVITAFGVLSKTTTEFVVHGNGLGATALGGNNNSGTKYWEVKGMYA